MTMIVTPDKYESAYLSADINLYCGESMVGKIFLMIEGTRLSYNTSMKLSAAHFSEKGNSRDTNQDYLIADEANGVFILCDGVSGNNGGEVASELAAKTLYQLLTARLQNLKISNEHLNTDQKESIRQILMQSLDVMASTVMKKGNSNHTLKGMATTLDVILIVVDTVFIAHIGNGRIYLNREGRPIQITQDHTLAQEFVNTGHWTLDQAKKSPYSKVLARSVGSEEYLKYEYLEIEGDVHDQFLICTNGVYNAIEDKTLENCMLEKKGIKEIVDNLKNKIEAKSAKDNYSAILISYSKSEVVHERKMPLKVDVLKSIPIFKSFTFVELSKVLEKSRLKELRKGEMLFEQNTHSNEMYVILRGTLSVFKDNKRLITRKEGDAIGEMSMIDQAPRSATICADSDCTLLSFNRDELFELFKRNSLIAAKFFWSLSVELNTKLRNTSEQLTKEISQRKPNSSPF